MAERQTGGGARRPRRQRGNRSSGMTFSTVLDGAGMSQEARKAMPPPMTKRNRTKRTEITRLMAIGVVFLWKERRRCITVCVRAAWDKGALSC
ncbi:protein of unknown function [Azospirillum baldaniorum]|uniref:Uncharacterized protein n=1 Tax=Azospirillum baldaniorum TaxID=1064539 RepID=A0A9P1JNT3_9PROT|nr:protein of unknown function [Azospirillum baldaniorum]